MTERGSNVMRRVAISAASILAILALVGAAMADDILYDFHAQPRDARAWLASQGFELKLDAPDAARTRLTLSDASGLTIETLAPAEPLIAHANLRVAEPAVLTVTWGVNRYPAGANWDTGANNEAIMVMVSFGTETYWGGLFVPPSPYFIGFFLCEKGRRHVAIPGRSYTRQGRYVCVDGPAPGHEITTVIQLDDQFRRAFGTSGVLPVTGLAVEADTTQVPAPARSSAWVRSIRIAPAQ